MVEWTVPVSGLSCEGCASTVTEQLLTVDGIESVDVELVGGGTSTLRLSGPREVDDAELLPALQRGGAFTIARG